MTNISKRQALKFGIVILFTMFVITGCFTLYRIFVESSEVVWLSNLNFQSVDNSQDIKGTDFKIVTAPCPNPLVECRYLANKSTGKSFLGTDYMVQKEVNNSAVVELKGEKYIILEDAGETGFGHQIYKIEGDSVIAARFKSRGEEF